MKNLILSSLFSFIFLTCCSPVKDLGVSEKTMFSGQFEKKLFKTSLDIKKNHLSGYTLIKKTADSTFHIIFSNEIGMTIYDFELTNGLFKVNYLFESMNKKVIVSIFERNFRLLIFGTSMPGQNFFNRALISTEESDSSLSKKIILTNPGIHLKMQLRPMNL